MSDVQPFTFPTTGTRVRTIIRDGAPWFVARDVCDVLGIGNASQAVSYLDHDERGHEPLTTNDGSGRILTTNVINEPGLYSLILRSRRPQARAFKRWVTHEVLPSLRRTGRYDIGERLSGVELARHWYEAEQRAEAAELRAMTAEATAAELTPSAEAWEELASAQGDYSLRDAAQILTRAGIITGQNRLLTYLRTAGWVGRDDQPYQRHVDAGRITRRAVSRTTAYGRTLAAWQVRVTPAGLRKLRRDLTAERLPATPLPTVRG